MATNWWDLELLMVGMTLIMFAARIFGINKISWPWVFAPMWIPLVAVLIVLIAVILFYGCVLLGDWIREKL